MEKRKPSLQPLSLLELFDAFDEYKSRLNPSLLKTVYTLRI